MRCKHCGQYINYNGRYNIYVHNGNGLATCLLPKDNPDFMRVSAEPEEG